MNFYLSKNGQKLGPYSVEQIQVFLKQGLATTADQVWADGWPSWMSIGNVPGLAPAQSSEQATPSMVTAQGQLEQVVEWKELGTLIKPPPPQTGIKSSKKPLLKGTDVGLIVGVVLTILCLIVVFMFDRAYVGQTGETKSGNVGHISASLVGIYCTADSSQALNIIGDGKVERQDSDGIFPGSYTLDGDTIRMELTILGTPQVFYFTKVEEGWQEKDGALFLSPHYFGAVQILQEAKDGDLEKVTPFLKDYPDLVFSKDDNGETPLFLAADNGHKDAVDLLLANKADVDAKNNDGDTPLAAAAANDHLDVVQSLMASKADVNAKNNSGGTPLLKAAINGNDDVVKLLLASQVDVNAKDNDGDTPLLEAASNDHMDVAQSLLAAKADVNAKDNDGNTPFSEAMNGRYDMDLARVLLASGAVVNICDAAKLDSLDKVSSLLADNPALISSKNEDGDTPLNLAAENGDVEMVKLLLDKGADVNAEDNAGLNSLYLAGIDYHKDVMKVLLDKGANVNAKAQGVCTPLRDAVDAGDKEMVKLLLDRGADVNAKDNLGATPLDSAKDDDMKALLTQHGGQSGN